MPVNLSWVLKLSNTLERRCPQGNFPKIQNPSDKILRKDRKEVKSRLNIGLCHKCFCPTWPVDVGGQSLIEESQGKDRWHINLNSPGAFLGIMPKYKILKQEKGGTEKRSRTWPASTPLEIFLWTTTFIPMIERKCPCRKLAVELAETLSR